MNDEAKSKEELIGELSELRQRIVELEVATVAHQQTDEALRESEERYRNLSENATDLIQSVDPVGRVLYVNPVWRETLGYSEEEIKGLSFLDIIHPDSETHCMETFRRVLSGEKIEKVEAVFVAKNGRKIAVEGSVSCTFIEGKPAYTVGIFRDITDRKRTDEALRESELKYRDLVDNSLVGIYRTNLEGNILYVNEALIKMLDFDSPEEMMSEGVTTRYKNHKDRERLLGILKEFGKVDNFEFALLTSKGETIQGLLSAVLDGDVLSGMIMNISGRKQDEEALRESEERYKSLFKNNHAVMLLIDPESADIVDANPAACSFYGWSQEELTRKKITDINMLTSEQVFQEMERAKSEERQHFFFPHRLANEEIRDVELYSGPIRLHGKELLYSIIHDITERKRAEEALRKEKDKARRYLDTAGVIMVALNADECMELINMKGCEVLGYDEEEIVGKNWFDIFVPERLRENIRVYFARLLAGEIDPVEYYENPILTKDGEERLIAWHNTVLRNDQGDIVATLSSGEDITERKRADAELRALALRLEELEEAERRRLAQELHDSVGQNLTALSINLNFVRKVMPLGTNTMASDRLAECLSLVVETAERIRNVMAELRPSVLDDYGLIAALHWYAERFSARTELTTTLLPEQELKVTLPPIVETAIFRIVQEALTNVVKHAKARQVTIQVEEIQGDIRLVVADDGVGFDPKILGQPGGQMGWGLVTMRERATAVGGHLSVNSEPGKGTQVVLEIRG